MTLEEIADIVETEGLEYALTAGYLKPDDFEDPDLGAAAAAARSALTTLENALEDYLP